MKEPKDLGVKIGTPLESLWSRVKKESELLIEQSTNNLIVQKAMLEMAKKKIREEKLKIKE